MDVVIAVGFALLVLVTALGAYDSRDGRDWQPRPDYCPRQGD
jgi:hypothetical protein